MSNQFNDDAELPDYDHDFGVDLTELEETL